MRHLLTRATSVAFVSGLAVGIVATAVAASTKGHDVFSDVPSDSYYDDAVGEMYDIGIVKGSGGKYRPEDPVNRAEIAVMLKRLRDEMTGNVDTSSSSRSSRSSSSSSSTSSSSSSSSSTSSSSSSYNSKGTMRFTTSELRVPENVSTHKITVAVVRTGGNDGSVTIDYTMAGGTATEGSDYTKSSGTLTFANKETSKTFDVAIKDDSTNEGNETVTITLSNPGGGVSVGTPSSASLIITDDEAGSSSSSKGSSASTSSMGPNVGYGAASYSVNENAGTLTVTVLRGGSSSSTAAVNYATSNGSGKSGSEYTATTGTLTFAAGETSKTFTVAVFDDGSDDGAKTFTLTLTSPTGAILTPNLSTANVTINDNETVEFGSGSFKFSKSAYAVSENGGNAVLTVQRTGSTANAAFVGYSTSTITANGGTDFTHVSGTLNFAVNESAKIILVPILKDDVADTAETFAVDLQNPSSNTTLLTPYEATVTIE